MKIFQISDSHISVDHSERTLDLKTCIQSINGLSKASDIVIHTGDITHNGLPEEYNIAKTCLNKLNVPYHVLAGNRDNRVGLIQAFADGRFIHHSDRFVQYSIESYAKRLLVVDTLCEHSNKGQLCTERFGHLEKMLAADTDRPALVFLHHTPFEVPPIPDPFQFEDWADVDQLRDLLAAYPAVVGLYCGHIHRNVDGAIANLPIKAITCMARDLRKGKLTDDERNRPAIREIAA